MKRSVLSLTTVVVAAVMLEAAPARADASKADELAKRAATAAQSEKYGDAIELMREAYRQDPSPRWYYDLGVLHDHLGECDDAAFFYRAAMWGKAVLPQERAPVEARLATLEDKCHFRKRHATASDRHVRAARFIGLHLCPLAAGILTGIATPTEKAQLEDCEKK